MKSCILMLAFGKYDRIILFSDVVKNCLKELKSKRFFKQCQSFQTSGYEDKKIKEPLL